MLAVFQNVPIRYYHKMVAYFDFLQYLQKIIFRWSIFVNFTNTR